MTNYSDLAEELREYTAMKYAGDCKCGKCQLVPRALVERIYHTLNSAAARPAQEPTEAIVQRVKEACAQVADRAALRCVREQIHGDSVATFIAKGIRALIPLTGENEVVAPPQGKSVSSEQALEALRGLSLSGEER